VNWRNFTRGLLVSTLLFGGVLFGLTLFTSPDRGLVAISFYYIALFFFVMGLTTLILFYAHKWWHHNEVSLPIVKGALRQGVLLSVFLISLLVLSSMQLLTWWDGAILAISFILLELFFKARR
jgi:amino acid transporter